MHPFFFPTIVGSRSKWTPKSESTLTWLVDWNSTKFKDLARSQSVTADGDAVSSVTDQIGGRNLRAMTEAEAPTWRPNGGSASGKGGIEFSSGGGTPDGPLYFPTGSQILNDQPFTMGCVFQRVATGVTSGIMGRGVAAGNWHRLDAADRIGAQRNTSVTGSGNNILVAGAPAWRACLTSYDGVNYYRGANQTASPFLQTGSIACTGSLVFDPADTAFWVGGQTADGTTFSNTGSKILSFAFVMTRVMTSTTDVANLLRNMLNYAGLAT